MESLKSFVPAALLERINAGRSDAPVSARFEGSVLFADISGYTALAEQFCGTGAPGLEKLADVLNSAFRRYADCIQQTGGEIACFAGDALLAYWAADAEDIGTAFERARQSACLLQAPSIGNTQLQTPKPALHIGLGTGPLWAARLGGVEGRWHVLLAGAAVRQATGVAAHAGPGETLLTPAADAVRAGGKEAASDFALPHEPSAGGTITQDTEDDADEFIPRVVREWAAEGYSSWLPQLRNVCALFVRIDGLNEETSDALTRHQAAVVSLLTVLRLYSGSGGTLLLDDKGLVFKLCLGLPHDSHADDALRAVRAAFAIETELARFGLGCAAGVAAGRGLCMPLGGPSRQHYVAVGRFMHVAARLMQEARSGLLCTAEVADRVRNEVTLSPERPLKLKGIRQPLHSFRVRDAAHRALPRHRLFGREFEKKQLDACLDALEKGQKRLLWMVGDAGVGKSALVHYLTRTAARRGMTCLEGGAGSVEVEVPYAPWRPVFAELLKHGEEPRSPEQQRERLQRVRHPQLVPLLNAVIPGFVTTQAYVDKLSGEARAEATLTVLSEVIGLLAPSRLVLVLEDCHWMDSASWRLAARVAQDHPNAFVILTSRPDPDPRHLDLVHRLDGFVELALPPLRRDAVGRLVESLLEHGAASAELIEEIAERSVGNPLFAREYTLLLASTARLVRGDTGWGVATPAPHESSEPMPVTVEGLITSRLDGLSPEEDLVLKAASVLGDRFEASLLARMTPVQRREADLDRILAKLVQSQLLVETGIGVGTYAFRHSLIREVSYDQLTFSQRRSLHQGAALAVADVHAGNLAPHYATLARHWSVAGVPAPTIEYADLAASQALASGAYLEADRLLRSCIDACQGDAAAAQYRIDQIRWYRQLADARRGLGQLESRGAAARQALVLAGEARPTTRAGLGARAAAQAMRLYLRRAILPSADLQETALSLEIARAYRHSAEVCYFQNDMLGMICDSVSAVARAETAGPSAVLAGASTELGGVLSVAGLRNVGEGILRRAIKVAEGANDHSALAYAHMISCLYDVGAGAWQSAQRSAQLCQDICEPMDDRVNWTNAQAMRFWLNHYQSRDETAYEAAQRLSDSASETGNRQHQAWALRFLGLCELRRGKPAEAARRLESALERLGETAALNERIPALGLLAMARLGMGEAWAARATARETLALTAHAGRPISHSTLEGYSALAEVILDAWRAESTSNWQREARRCLRILRRYRAAFPIGEPRYRLLKGRYDEMTGRHWLARRSYRRGSESARRLGMPWDEARCAAELKRLSEA